MDLLHAAADFINVFNYLLPLFSHHHHDPKIYSSASQPFFLTGGDVYIFERRGEKKIHIHLFYIFDRARTDNKRGKREGARSREKLTAGAFFTSARPKREYKVYLKNGEEEEMGGWIKKKKVKNVEDWTRYIGLPNAVIIT